MIRGEEVEAEIVTGDDEQLGRVRARELVRRSQLVEPRIDLAERDKVRAEHVPGPALLRHGPRLDGVLDGLLADRPRFRPSAEAHECSAKRTEDASTARRGWLGRYETNRLAVLSERRLAFAAGPHQVAQSSVEDPGESRIGDRIGQGQGVSDEADAAIELAGQVGRLGGQAANLDPFGGVRRGLRWQDALETDRPLEQPLRVGVCVDCLGRGRRGDGGAMGLDRTIGRRPVAGELGGCSCRRVVGEVRASLELAGHVLVQLATLPGGQLDLHDLAQQLVPEGVATVRQRDEHAPRRRFPESGADLSIASLDQWADQPLVNGPTGDSQRPDDRQGVAIQRRDTSEERIDKRGHVRPLGCVPGGEQLLREERVALRSVPDRIDDLVANRTALDRLQLPKDVDPREAGEVHSNRARCATDLGQPGQNRMAGREIVRPAGEDRHDPLRRHVAH